MEKNKTMNNPIVEIRKMINGYDYKNAEIILDALEKILGILSELDFNIDTYLNKLRLLVNYYSKMDKEYFYKNIINDLLYIGKNMVDENEKEINIYINDLSEIIYGRQDKRKRIVKELEKKELKERYKVDTYLKRATLKASLGALILCSGIQFGPEYADSKANSHYALEKNIDTGEEEIYEISSKNYSGKNYVREYSDYKIEKSVPEYYRQVIDYMYADELEDGAKKVDFLDEVKYRDNLKSIESKLDSDLEIYNVKIESTNENIKNLNGKVVVVKEYEEYNDNKYKKILLLIKILTYSSFIISLLSTGDELIKCGEYIRTKEKLKTAIDEYDYYVYNEELDEAEELNLAKSLFKR